MDELRADASDLEAGDLKRVSSKFSNSSTSEPVLSTDTPFFHLDLHAAVRAAESSLERASASSSS